MRHRLILVLAAMALLLETSAAWAGDIQGTLTIRSSLRPRATGKSASKGGDEVGPSYSGSAQSDSGPVTLSRDQEIPYVVISLSGKGLPATPQQYVMRQKNREFIPHVLPVVKGSTVTFTNEDSFFHSIYSESTTGPFSLPKYGRGKKERQTFHTPGPVELFCGIHSIMNAYIYVTENDFFTQPDKAQRFILRNVPAGTYTLRVWHPRANPLAKTLTVPASGAVTLDLAL